MFTNEMFAMSRAPVPFPMLWRLCFIMQDIKNSSLLLEPNEPTTIVDQRSCIGQDPCQTKRAQLLIPALKPIQLILYSSFVSVK